MLLACCCDDASVSVFDLSAGRDALAARQARYGTAGGDAAPSGGRASSTTTTTTKRPRATADAS